MRHIHTLLVLATAFALALAGCGGGGGGGDNGGGIIDDGNVQIAISPKYPEGLGTQGEQQLFTAIVTGSSDTSATWEVNGQPTGVTGTSYTFTAPSFQGNYTITARSHADPTKSDSATIHVGPPDPPSG